MSQPVSRRLGRGLGRATYVAYGAAVIVTVMLALWLVTLFVRRPRRAIALQRAASRIMLAFLGCRFSVHGPWPADGAGARVFVANHTSYLDIPLMLAAMPHDFAFVTKRELLEWPVVSLITRAGRHIPVDRDRLESRGAVVARIVKTLRAGRSVFLFPEGTFSHDDGLRPFHAGAFKAALAAGVPVVPVALEGVGRVWSQHARFPRPGAVEIYLGEPLDAAGGRGRDRGDDAARMEALREAAVRFIAARTNLVVRAPPMPHSAHTMQKGTVKFFNTAKGFGFITPEGGGKDVFVHANDTGGAVLQEGAKVEFEVVQGKKGPQASAVKVL